MIGTWATRRIPALERFFAGDAVLAAVADAVGDALVAGSVPDAPIVAAERLGAVISPAFPKTASDLNELPHHLLVSPAST